jgi:hypothetical protein
MGMGTSVRARTLTAIACAAIGCNALTGVNDLVPVDQPVATSSDAGGSLDGQPPPPPVGDAGATPDGHGHLLDDGALLDSQTIPPVVLDAATDASTVCTGLTMLLRFDNKTTSAEGDSPTNTPQIQFSPGKFGEAVAFPTNQHLEYAAQRAGNAILLPGEGTVSIWVRSLSWSAPCNNKHTFFALDTDGLYLDCEPQGVFGEFLDLQKTFVGVELPPPSANGSWTGNYNHLVGTWSQTPARMSVTLNGNVGAETTAAWSPPHPTVSTFFISFPNEASGASFDDVAVWTRKLSAQEIAGIYAANRSIGDVCGLP